MKLILDTHPVEAKANQSLLEMARELGLVTGKLSTDPIAAKIAGEVFTLNYIPLREKELHADRPSMRRAMAASNGVVQLLRYSDPAGREAYVRTAQFVIFWPCADCGLRLEEK